MRKFGPEHNDKNKMDLWFLSTLYSVKTAYSAVHRFIAMYTDLVMTILIQTEHSIKLGVQTKV